MLIRRLLIQTIAQQQSQVNSVRLYGRWLHRNPVKVLLPFEPTTKLHLKKENVINMNSKILNETEEKHPTEIGNDENKHFQVSLPPAKSKEVKSKKKEKLRKRKFYLSQQKIFDDNCEIIYEKFKDNDGRISTLLTNLKSKKERLRSRQVLVEGWRLIVDGLEAKCKLNYVIFSRVEDLNKLRPFLPKTGIKFFKIPYKEIELWSNVETSPGVFGIFEMPTSENIRRLSKPLPLDLICDNIRVPGNLGAILRIAVGAGCEKVLLTKGCVDVWEPKVVRSAAGAHFRLPIHNGIDWEDMPKFLEEHTSVFIADSDVKITEYEGVDDKFDALRIPVLPYYGVQYSTLHHITLVIGGETEGISEDSYRLVFLVLGTEIIAL
ncbi:rRNA methyltransferase 3, mitochondrial isoform X2 [Hyposmocoma kahamanoa]|uniref:rRNA methyltransferase 3, mitochondrial isoform X2 n=1 Tax=Hyposmocoma kahamanoa TaxID=1477025 RepID=UPI000E6D9435|nr:rRNA methyltransferase 3, mitochondrial isoform X2 [Hyposmocoma kahamanoa]